MPGPSIACVCVCHAKMGRSDDDNSVLLSLRVRYTAAILAALFKLGIRQV